MAKFPDLTGDGQVTQADILKGRGVYKKGGSVMKNDHGHKPMAKMSHGGHYCWGGKVMKKAAGGIASGGPAPTPIKRPGAPSANLGSGGGSRPSINPALIENKPPRGGGPAPTMIPGPKPIGPITPMPTKPSPRELYLGGSKNFDESTGSYRGSSGIKSQAGYKKGGMAKGGNWIQSAIKKPGALKKSLGVPMGEKIPAGKLKTASKAPGKMGQRARMAMTLKGMK